MGPPPGYTPYGAGDSFGAPSQSGKATAALVCGIVGIFICPIVLSILAIVPLVYAVKRWIGSGPDAIVFLAAVVGLLAGSIVTTRTRTRNEEEG